MDSENELMHYGIKGMRWKNHIYANYYSPAGIQNYYRIQSQYNAKKAASANAASGGSGSGSGASTGLGTKKSTKTSGKSTKSKGKSSKSKRKSKKLKKKSTKVHKLSTVMDSPGSKTKTVQTKPSNRLITQDTSKRTYNSRTNLDKSGTSARDLINRLVQNASSYNTTPGSTAVSLANETPEQRKERVARQAYTQQLVQQQIAAILKKLKG